MKWTIRDPKRFLFEHDSVEKLDAEVDWIGGVHWRLDTSSLLLVVDLNLLIHGRTYEAFLTYPDAFPDTPAYIRPRDSSQRWTTHQYGAGGSLCLEWRSDNWVSEITGADLIRSAHKLLYAETHPDSPQVVPSAHRLTQGQEVHASNYRLVVTTDFLAEVGKLPSDTALAICTNSLVHKSSTVCVISEVADPTGTMKDIPDVPKGISTYFPLFAWRGSGFLLRSPLLGGATVNSVAKLSTLIEQAGFSHIVNLSHEAQGTRFRDTLIVIAGTDDAPLRAFGVADDEIHDYTVVGTSAKQRRLSPAHAVLPSLLIAIVGVGSLGSKIAVSLARCGCRKFLLIDDDIFLPENVCRNELSWDSIGIHKADATAEALSLIGPGIEIDVRIHRLAGQESSIASASVLKAVASADLIIDATANADVFTLLASVARINRKPMCWGEVFAGGIGGLIARARPDRDPNPLAVRDGINHYYEDLPPAPHMNAAGYDIDDAEPIIADDPAVSHVASAIARMALDMALQQNPSAFPHTAYLLGLQPEWIFSSAFDTRPIDVTGPDWGQPAATDEDRGAAVNILLQILNDGTDDPANTAAEGPPDNRSGAA